MQQIIKLSFFLFIFLISNIVFSQSQNLSDYPYLLQEHDGYIITPANDSIVGRIYLGTLPAYITFTPANEPGKTKNMRKKDCLKAVIPGHIFKVAEFKDAITIGSSDDFMEVIADGPMKLYRRFLVVRNVSVGAGTVSTPKLETTDIIMRPDGKSMATNDIRLFNFSKGMSKFLLEYPELSNKILNKEKGYGKMDLPLIVNEYNNWKLNK